MELSEQKNSKNSFAVSITLLPSTKTTTHHQLYRMANFYLRERLRGTEAKYDMKESAGRVEVSTNSADFAAVLEVFWFRGLLGDKKYEEIKQHDLLKPYLTDTNASVVELNGAGKAMAVYGICSAARVSEVVPEVAPQVGPQKDKSSGNGKGVACSRVTAV